VSFAELCLRLGLVLVAWLLVLAHCLWLAVLPRVDCAANGTLPWLLTLGAAPLVMASAWVLPSGRRVPGVGHLLRLFALPLPLLLPLAAWATAEGLSAVTLGGGGFCAGVGRSGWEAWWAPVQATALAVVVWGAARSWMRSA